MSRPLLLVLTAGLSLTTGLSLTSGLSGTRWKVNLDVGPEPGTWMPPTWGLSGTRVAASCELLFRPDGKLTLLKTGPWDHLTVAWNVDLDDDSVGGWNVDGEKATFFLEHLGLERSDVALEAGRLYATAGAWGPQLGRKGNLTIRKRKMGWLPFLPTPNEASFLVGQFRTQALDSNDDEASRNAVQADVR